MWPFRKISQPEKATETVSPAAAPVMWVKDSDIAWAKSNGEHPVDVYVLPAAAPGVIPKDAKMACDSAVAPVYQFASQCEMTEGLSFPGYAYLAELMQRPEYRRAVETIAKDMSRKWMCLHASGNGDKSERIAQIEAELNRLGAQAAFRKAAELDGSMGRGQIYLDTGYTDDPDELPKPLALTPTKIGIGALKRLVVVEPMWTYPNVYNATDPLKPDYYQPEEWYVQGKRIHSSRLLFFISREVPDILKPAYSFGGLSLSQMMKPYVDNWIQTRQSVSNAIHNFSTSVLKTNMSATMNTHGAEGLTRRAQMFNLYRDNQSLMVLDKDTEDFSNVSMPLASLDKLQAQAQEHLASVTGLPLVKLTGISPSGLNASSEGEIVVYDDWILANQEATFRPNLKRLIDIIQLSLFGDIDDDIGFTFEPLRSLDELQLATARKTEADMDCAYLEHGVLSPEEVRQRLASDKDSPYASLEVSDVPPLPEPGDEGEPGDEFDNGID